MKKIAITGAAGLIGKELVYKLLKKNFLLKILDLKEQFIKQKEYYYFLKRNKNVEIIKGSILESKKCLKLVKDVDLLIHLGAMLGVKNTEMKRYDCYNVNFKGTENLLNSLIHNKCNRIIFASSSEVYGEPKKNPIKEDFALNGTSIYALTKILSEKQIIAYQKMYKSFNYTILRFFNTYGPNQVAQFLIPKFFNLINKNKSFLINGDGNQVRGYLYVTDLVENILSIINNKNTYNKIYNLGNSREVYKIKTLVKKILKLTKIKNKVIYDRFFKIGDRNKSREIYKRICSTKLAEKDFSFKASTTLDAGFRQMFKQKNFRENW